MAAPASSSSSSHSTTPLLYSCIAHGTTILAEHTASPSSSATSALASVVLPKIQHTTSSKLSFSHQNNLIHYIALSPSDYPSSSASQLTFLVVGTRAVGQRVPFGYLVEVKKRFLSQYDPERTDFAALPPYGCAAFNGRLKEMLVQYGATAEGREDAISKAQREIEDVREIMVSLNWIARLWVEWEKMMLTRRIDAEYRAGAGTWRAH